CMIIYKDGKKEEKSLEETKKFIEQEEKKAFESDKLVTNELKKSISNLKSPEAVREAKEYLTNEFLYRSDVIEVRWPARKNHLTERFHLVDTPGLVQNNLSGDAVMGLQKYYPKADGVLWLLDATKIASKQSKEMIDELEKSFEKVGGRTDNIIAVVNRMDSIRKNGGEQAVQAVLKDVQKIFGSYFNKILPISAKEAFDGILSNDTVLLEQSGMLQLQNEIKTNFLKNAQKIQLSSKITGYKQVVYQLNDHEHPIQKYIKRLKVDLSDFSKKQSNIKKKYKEKKEAYEENLQEIMDEFESDLRIRVESNAETLFDLESEESRKDYIKNQILKFELLETELQKFVKYWKKDLDLTLKTMQKEAVFTEYKFIDPYKLVKHSEIISKASTKNLNFELSNGTIDTGELSVASGAGFAFIGAMILGPIGLLLGGITGALGINKGIAKLFKSGKLKRQLNEAAAEQLATIQENILIEIEKLAEQGEKNVLQVLNATFQELHAKSKNNKKVQNLFMEFFECLENPIDYPDFQMLLIDEYEKKIKG
ncbi:MAG: dynamin family protein, partial [Planococcus donghaensis]